MFELGTIMLHRSKVLISAKKFKNVNSRKQLMFQDQNDTIFHMGQTKWNGGVDQTKWD